jgi:hypothetical protein
MFLKNVSFGPPFEISIKFRQKSLKNYEIMLKKNFKQTFGDFAKNCPKNPMSLPLPSPSPPPPPTEFLKFSELASLAQGTLLIPDNNYFIFILCNLW